MSEATEIVAIDGPAGAGKSTVARRAARRLGFAFLDTGAMYRAATWRALQHGVPLDDSDALIACTRTMDLDLSGDPDEVRVQVDGTDVTQAIRTPEVTRAIHELDNIPEVRAHLVQLQRRFGEAQPTVAEGRDIGTVVFPQARCKIYMDASPRERARRRAEELRAAGQPADPERIEAEIRERDEHNLTRAASPLRKAPDAVVLDSTRLTLDEAVDAVVRLAREKLCAVQG